MKADEVSALLCGMDDEWLFEEARTVRREVFGRDVYLRGVVEFSNYCVNSCLYCGLRNPNREVNRYRMGTIEILRTARLAFRSGIGSVVLQSGDDFHYTSGLIGQIVREIKSAHDVAVTLSLGDRRPEELRFWRDCGADRYLLKIETFNRDIYEKMRPGSSIDDRLRRIELMRRTGYEIGSGVITNLPGMTLHGMAQDIIRLTELDLDMIAVGPFVPHPDTPLGWEPHGDVQIALRACALLRVMNPYANIPATSALSSVAPGARQRALFSGANVLMPSVTPDVVRGHYTIYPGKNSDALMFTDRIAELKTMIRAAGFRPSSAKGFSPRRNNGQGSARSETCDQYIGKKKRRQIVAHQRHNR